MDQGETLFILALALEDDAGRWLVCQRDPDFGNDFGGKWTLPSIRVGSEQFERIANCPSGARDALSSLSSRWLGGIAVRQPELVALGQRAREHGFVKVAVFQANGRLDLPSPNAKYSAFQVVSPSQFTAINKGELDTVGALFLEGLYSRGTVIDIWAHREVAPDQSRRSQDSAVGHLELWDRAAKDYALMLDDASGGDGGLIRRVTLDRCVEATVLDAVLPTDYVIDIGSGTGQLVGRLLGRTAFAYGLEPAGFEYSDPNLASRVKRGSIQDAALLYEGERFDWVVLNLVLEWLPDLAASVQAVRGLVRPGARVFASMTAPGFNKHDGRWEVRNGEYSWVVDEPLRKRPKLAMINRSVGPVMHYSRTLADYVVAFGACGMHCSWAEDVYLDSYLSPTEVNYLLSSRPMLKRDLLIPIFTAMVMKVAP